MSIPDGITWVGRKKKSERSRIFFDLNFKLCKNIIFAHSFVCYFYTHFSTSTHANTMDAMLCCVVLCLLTRSTMASYQAKFNENDLSRATHK